jgi:hypothetical protein
MSILKHEGLVCKADYENKLNEWRGSWQFKKHRLCNSVVLVQGIIAPGIQ